VDSHPSKLDSVEFVHDHWSCCRDGGLGEKTKTEEGAFRKEVGTKVSPFPPSFFPLKLAKLTRSRAAMKVLSKMDMKTIQNLQSLGGEPFAGPAEEG